MGIMTPIVADGWNVNETRCPDCGSELFTKGRRYEGKRGGVAFLKCDVCGKEIPLTGKNRIQMLENKYG